MAEGVGFEPTVDFRLRQFSKLLPSTSQPTLLKMGVGAVGIEPTTKGL